MYSLGKFKLGLVVLLLLVACANSPTMNKNSSISKQPILSFANWEYEADSYRIKLGENWQILEQRTEVPASILKRYNSLKSIDQPTVGQKIAIPAKKIYKVKNGETAIGIAAKHGMTFSELLNLNYLNEPYELLFGQSLKVIEVKIKEHSVKIIKRKPQSSLANFQLAWPVTGKIIESFGPQINDKHNDGVKISIKANSKIKAAAQGEVVYSGNEIGSYGNLIIIQHHGGWFSSYGYLDEIRINKGDYVEIGQVIGYINKKDSTLALLYFSLRKGKSPVNPIKYLSKLNGQKRKK
jgi:murein DD-endopeptidase MepM/ murein hydrolase activator NlpD